MNREKLEACVASWRSVMYPRLEHEYVVKADLRAALLALLKALLEESPDVGHEAHARELDAIEDRIEALETKAEHPLLVLSQEQERRLTMLEARREATEAALQTIHGSLKALEGAAQPRWRDGVEERLQGLARRIEEMEGASEGRRGRLDKLQRLNHHDVWGRPATMMDLVCLLDALLGPPDVGRQHEWVTEAEAAPKDLSEVLATLGRQLTQIDALVGQAAAGLAPKRGATACPICLSNICRGDVDARGCDTRAATRKAIQP